ncbi:two-component system response regulator VanR [Metabacillus crassostreae]|uniref:VanR-ABDEGLN family response regulator transcription factor n=1 Tax=Metabacillus crassostreae TaxID=929098 RepID=UPI00195D20C2|nr:VanR-ABDEGLN family response regulator transcription factor [Metabacillus crassostreae]MBM7602493.1 two-component system response regulator VanR [Metabacillus crassostreae]
MDQRILLVEDEEDISNLLKIYLYDGGYIVDFFHNGQDALNHIETHKQEYDLAILDVMVPGINGFDLCRKIREKYFYPIIMLTAKIEDIDKITGLTLGADDYITKPFNPLEVMARVKTQLRRYKRYNEHSVKEKVNEYDFRGLKINKATHTCSLFGETVDLTPIEFSILWYLSENQGRVIPSEELFENVWGEKFIENNNTVMAHIARLREKLKEPFKKPKFIKTVWGVGYKLE